MPLQTNLQVINSNQLDNESNLISLFLNKFVQNNFIEKIITLSLYQADFSSVSVLKTNEVAIEDINTKKIANLEKIATLDPTTKTQVNKELDKILLSYGTR